MGRFAFLLCARFNKAAIRTLVKRLIACMESVGLCTVQRAPLSTYDHTCRKIRDPVRSPIVKPVRGGSVVGSVTTSESPLLYVFC
ncbi:putative quinate permease [Fusarium oxysporum f. sp. albedinis]|nr:putative quinate permease [Fusarium oxysporum f. sp. albedinis]